MKTRDCLLIVLMTALLSVPAGYEPGHFAKMLFATAAVQSAGWAVVLWWLTRRNAWLRLTVVLILFLLFAVETFTYLRFGSRFNPAILTIVLQTTRTEAWEFLRTYVRWWHAGLLLAGLAAVVGLTHMLSPSAPRRYSSRRKPLNRLLRLGAAAGVALLCCLPLLPLPCAMGHNSVSELVASTRFVVSRHGEIDRLMAVNTMAADVEKATEGPAVYLILGESFDRHHSSLYGYSLPTSPRLEAERKGGLLTVFTEVTSPTCATADAMRLLFTLQGCEEPAADDTVRYVLMPAVFRKAGWNVRYLDNQFTRTSGGALDYSCAYFLNPAPISEACFDFRNDRTFAFDDDFVSHYADSLSPRPATLTIVHLKGQHFDAAERYPEREAFFTAADIRRPDLSERQRRQVAEYDNATRYNDRVVAHILDLCRCGDAVAVYLSDHGEQLYDGPHHYFGRTFGAYWEPEVQDHVFRIPLTIWCSPAYAAAHPAVTEAVSQAADLPFCSADLPYLLFHLAGIDSPHHQPARSPLSTSYQPHAIRLGL